MMLLITYILEHFDLLIFFTEQVLEEEQSWATNYFRIGLQSQDVRCSFVPCPKIWTETESQFLSEESLSLSWMALVSMSLMRSLYVFTLPICTLGQTKLVDRYYFAISDYHLLPPLSLL